MDYYLHISAQICVLINSKPEFIMIKRLSHIGIAVNNLEEASRFFRDAFNLSATASENFGELRFSFLPLDGTDLELLQSSTDDGVISKFIQKKGQGVHHLSFEVDDIRAELARLKKKGIHLIHEEPYRNAHNEWVAFIHPQSTFGVLVELIQPSSE